MKILYTSVINKPLVLSESTVLVAPENGDLIIDAPIVACKPNLTLYLMGKNICTTYKAEITVKDGDINIASESSFRNQGCSINGKNLSCETDYMYNGRDEKSIMHRELLEKVSLKL